MLRVQRTLHGSAGASSMHLLHLRLVVQNWLHVPCRVLVESALTHTETLARSRTHTHTHAYQDLDFSPFHETVIATASEDSSVRVWNFEGLFGCRLKRSRD